VSSRPPAEWPRRVLSFQKRRCSLTDRA